MATQQGEQPQRADRVASARNSNPTGEAKTPTGGSTPQRMPPGRTWLTFFFILLVNVMLARVLFPRGATPVKVPYTLFREQVTAHNVQAIYSRGASITGRFSKQITYPRDTTGGGKPQPVTDFATELPSFADPGLETLLINNGVEISAKPIQQDNTWLSLLYGFAPTLLLIALYVWIFRRAAKQSGGLGGMLGGNLGRSTARRYDQETQGKVTFEDVAG